MCTSYTIHIPSSISTYTISWKPLVIIYHYDIPFLDDNEMMSISHPSSQNVLLPKGDSRCTRPGSHISAPGCHPGRPPRRPRRGRSLTPRLGSRGGEPRGNRAWDHRKMRDFPGKMGKTPWKNGDFLDVGWKMGWRMGSWCYWMGFDGIWLTSF